MAANILREIILVIKDTWHTRLFRELAVVEADLGPNTKGAIPDTNTGLTDREGCTDWHHVTCRGRGPPYDLSHSAYVQMWTRQGTVESWQ